MAKVRSRDPSCYPLTLVSPLSLNTDGPHVGKVCSRDPPWYLLTLVSPLSLNTDGPHVGKVRSRDSPGIPLTLVSTLSLNTDGSHVGKVRSQDPPWYPLMLVSPLPLTQMGHMWAKYAHSILGQSFAGYCCIKLWGRTIPHFVDHLRAHGITRKSGMTCHAGTLFCV